eukprot:596658-Pyramimonas_sp.AAC.1
MARTSPKAVTPRGPSGGGARFREGFGWDGGVREGRPVHPPILSIHPSALLRPKWWSKTG